MQAGPVMPVNVAKSIPTLPDEIVLAIIEYCTTGTLPALARTCKRTCPIAESRLYRHVYFSHIELLRVRDGSAESWICGRCNRNCFDGLFGDYAEIQPISTRCIDLSRFVTTISQHKTKRDMVQSLRLDIQSASGWNMESDSWDSTDNEPHHQVSRWSPRGKMKETVDSVTTLLGHLSFSRAMFASACFDEDNNPRMIQTMGIPLPFVLLLPNYAIDGMQPLQTTQGSRLWDVHTALEYGGVSRIDHSSYPPQVVKISNGPIRDQGILILYHYTGKLEELEDIVGAPRNLQQFRRWLANKPTQEFEGNSIASTILRALKMHIEFVDERYPNPKPELVGHRVIGDMRCLDTILSPPKVSSANGSNPLADVVLLKDLTLERLSGEQKHPLLVDIQRRLFEGIP